MNVLSLFDGIGCGFLALKRLGITTTLKLSSEIEPTATTISSRHFPEIKHLGDVKSIDPETLPKIDLVLGGPPCQSFSVAGDGKGFTDLRGRLFYDYLRFLIYLKPKYFLMENVPMTEKDSEVITSSLGVIPLPLNSNCFSAQNRLRYYWTNIPLTPQPALSKLIIANVMEWNGLSWDSNYTSISKPIRTGTVKNGGQGDRIYSPFGKSPTLSASSGGTAGPCNFLIGTQDHWRKLSILEVERLQTLPDNYTKGVSEPKRRKLIGNCWTVDVISWILSHME